MKPSWYRQIYIVMLQALNAQDILKVPNSLAFAVESLKAKLISILFYE